MSAREQAEESQHEAERGSGGLLPGLAGALYDAADSNISLQLLQTIIASMTEAVVVADAEGNVILHNPASRALHGYEESAEALGTVGGGASLWQISDLAGNPLPVSEWPLTRALRGERFSGYEVRVRRTDTGRQFVGSYSGTAIRDEKGALQYALITIRDVTEQKEAEERMRESESRFRSVLERSLDAAYRRDLRRDRYDYLSPVIEQLTGYSPAEMGAMSMEEVWARIHPGDHEAVRQAMARAEATGKEVVEYRFKGKDGKYRWLADSFSLVTAAGGRRRYRGGTIRDISERKQAEKTLRQSEQQLALVINTAAAHIAYCDRECRFRLANRSYAERFGLTPVDLIGKHAREVLGHSAYETVRPYIDTVLSGRYVEFETEVELPEQGRRHMQARYAPARDAEGEVNGFVAVVTDITEQKKAEAALREREREFTTMANSIPQLAWMTDADGWIYWYNQRWYEYTGTTLEEVEGWGWQKVQHPDHVEGVVKRMKQAFESGEPWEDTFPLRRKDGKYRWFLSRALPIRDEAGEVVRWFGTNTDITERLQLEEAVRRRERQLRELNQTLEERVRERTQALARSGEALLEARNRFFTLFHSSPVPTVLTALGENMILDANAAFLQAFDLESSSVIGCPVEVMAERIHASDAGQARLRTLLREEGRAPNVELQLQNGSEERILLVSVETATLENRPVAVSTLIDITDRRRAERQARELAAELALAQERERKRIAEILHDDVQQVLVAMQIQLQMALEGDEDTLRTVVVDANEYVQELLEMTRSLSGQLRDPGQEQEHLLDNLHWIRDFMARSYHLTVAVDVAEKITIPDPDLRGIVLRLVRELLFNVVKHAGTDHARVAARRDGDALLIQVGDDGHGFDPAILEQREDGSGYGLSGMGHRLELFGGEFEVESAPGAGTVVTLRIPDDALGG